MLQLFALLAQTTIEHMRNDNANLAFFRMEMETTRAQFSYTYVP